MGRRARRAEFRAEILKFAKSALLAIAPALVLAGCQHASPLDEAQERCAKQGGMLMIVYTQEITMSGPGEQVPSPGRCVMPDNFQESSTPSPPQPAAQGN